MPQYIRRAAWPAVVALAVTLAACGGEKKPDDAALAQDSALARDLARVCQWQCDLFGGTEGSRAPFDRYLFQVTAVGEGYGGLEHRASTSLLCSRRDLPAPGVERITDDRGDEEEHGRGLHGATSPSTAPAAAGRRISNVDPRPGSLSIVISPPDGVNFSALDSRFSSI